MISFSLVEGIVLSTQPSPLGRRQPRTPLITLGVTARDPCRLVDRACTPHQKRGAPVYWYNPKTRKMEDVSTPTNDTEAIEMLDGHPNSVEFIAEYRGLRARCTAVSRSRWNARGKRFRRCIEKSIRHGRSSPSRLPRQKLQGQVASIHESPSRGLLGN